jgi:hypothetical protein
MSLCCNSLAAKDEISFHKSEWDVVFAVIIKRITMQHPDRNVYAQPIVPLIAVFCVLFFIGLMLIGFNVYFFYFFLIFGTGMAVYTYAYKRMNYFRLTEYGLTNQSRFTTKFLPWNNITGIRYHKTSFPNRSVLIVTSIEPQVSADIFLVAFTRKEILELIQEIIERSPAVIVDERLKKTLPYGLLPNDNIL